MIKGKMVVLHPEAKVWRPETVEKANELATIVEDATARLFVPGLLFGDEEEIKRIVDRWRVKLDEMIEDVGRYK